LSLFRIGCLHIFLSPLTCLATPFLFLFSNNVCFSDIFVVLGLLGGSPFPSLATLAMSPLFPFSGRIRAPQPQPFCYPLLQPGSTTGLPSCLLLPSRECRLLYLPLLFSCPVWSARGHTQGASFVDAYPLRLCSDDPPIFLPLPVRISSIVCPVPVLAYHERDPFTVVPL